MACSRLVLAARQTLCRVFVVTLLTSGIAFIGAPSARAEDPPVAVESTPTPQPTPEAASQTETPIGSPDAGVSPTATASATPEPTPEPAKTSARDGETRATQWTAHVLRRRTPGTVIANLDFPITQVPVILVARKGDLLPSVAIPGRFSRPGWRLLLQKSVAVQFRDNSGDFLIRAYLKGKVNEVLITAVGPKGERETERLYVYAPEAMEFHVVTAWDQLLLSAGFSFLSYSQSGFGEYQALSAVLSARYTTPESLSPRLGLIAGADMSVLTFDSSPIDRGPQILEGKIDGTYVIPTRDKRWRTQLLAGASYLTMFSYGSPFGFSNLLAPEIGLRARMTKTQKTAWIFEGRYVALATPNSVSSAIGDMLGQMGLNLSGSFSRLVSNSHRVEMGLFYSGYVYWAGPTTAIRVNQVVMKIGLSI